MRILTYNVHSCIGTDGKVSPERISEVIGRVNPDVACLQELDLQRKRTGRCDQAGRIAQLLGMSARFFPTIEAEAEQYGDAILSKHPMQISRAATFPPVPRPIPDEKRGAIWAEVKLAGVSWQIISTHLGLGRTERWLQAAHLSDAWIGEASRAGPVVLCGDLNSRPRSRVHHLLSTKLVDAHRLLKVKNSPTFYTRLPFICLDYIYVSRSLLVRDISVVKTGLSRVASDHFPLQANIAVSLAPV